MPDNKNLGTIFNSDINGLLIHSTGRDATPTEYKSLVNNMLDMGMNVLAQNVGLPDPTIYRSKVATTWDKYHNQVVEAVWGKAVAENDLQAVSMKALLNAGIDPLTITIEACRERGVLIIASYRMNAEDFYSGELDLYDFGRQHKNLRITGTNCLDPAHPEVFKHRMEIFTEMANEYDIDGIEFDFKRWYHMISDPHKNYPILTRMVAETRQMLDEVAKRKGRERLLLGVRVGASLETPPDKTKFPGISHVNANPSCKDQGTDVSTWIKNGDVDYVCPSLFWPRLPGLPLTKEFVELAKGTQVGIYPTVFPLPAWAEDEANPVEDSEEIRCRHRDEIVKAALQCYEYGADGISTFNWNRDDPEANIGQKIAYSTHYGRRCIGYVKVLRVINPKLGSPQALREYLR